MSNYFITKIQINIRLTKKMQLSNLLIPSADLDYINKIIGKYKVNTDQIDVDSSYFNDDANLTNIIIELLYEWVIDNKLNISDEAKEILKEHLYINALDSSIDMDIDMLKKEGVSEKDIKTITDFFNNTADFYL